MNKKDCIDKTGIDYVLKEYEDGTKLMISQLHQEILTIMDEIHRGILVMIFILIVMILIKDIIQFLDQL